MMAPGDPFLEGGVGAFHDIKGCCIYGNKRETWLNFERDFFFEYQGSPKKIKLKPRYSAPEVSINMVIQFLIQKRIYIAICILATKKTR